MKRIFFLSLLAIACGTTQQASSPSCPACPPILPPSVKDSIVYIDRDVPYAIHDTTVKHDTTTLPPVHDTTVKHDTIAPIIIKADSTLPFVILHPDPSGDSYSMLQAAIDNYINTGTGWPYLAPGVYNISHPLLWLKVVNGQFGPDYAQVTPHIEGPAFAKNTPDKYIAKIRPLYSNCFAMGVQKGKGGEIKNIAFYGQYAKASSLTPLDIDTLRFDQWSDGTTSDNRSSPYSGVVIDPFSRPEYYDDTVYKMYKGLESYYLPNMSFGGSTAIKITGCFFSNFIVGTMITPSMQKNAEEIDVVDCGYQNCISAYSATQAQSKANTFEWIQVWGGVHTIIHCGYWGFHHSDGAIAPMVDVLNIAGTNHELIFAAAYSFPITIKRVYAEGLFKIGWTDAFTGVHFQDCQIDFQNGQPGVPTPDYPHFGRGIHWNNNMLRIYNGGLNCYRLIFESEDNFFEGGTLSAPPVTGDYKPSFQHVQNYYAKPNWLDAPCDTTIMVAKSASVYCDRTTFNGYVLGLAGVQVGDVLVTQQIADDYPELVGTLKRYPLGFVTSISGDTTYLQNMGMGIHSGSYQVWTNRTKQ